MATTEQKVLITLFGATGDLADRKLFPALFKLYKRHILQDHFAVIGTARRAWNDEKIREVVCESIDSLSADDQLKKEFASHFYYLSHDVTDSSHYHVLHRLTDELDQKYNISGNRLFYLAMSPSWFGEIARQLVEHHFKDVSGYTRVIIEKPFGKDLLSAKKLSETLTTYFDEKEIFRIDHYLGKAMVQDLLPIRLANPLIESVWNSDFIDHIQITLSESVGIGTRGGYYDQSGALRDMVQNHLLQLLAIVSMDIPKDYSMAEIKASKQAAFDGLKPLTKQEVETQVVTGQYSGYRSEDQVDPASTTETFIAIKTFLKSHRWANVPFYLRTGKKMHCKNSTIYIQFKSTPSHQLLDDAQPNYLLIEVDPSEALTLNFNMKDNISQEKPTFTSIPLTTEADKLKDYTPEAYERLIEECLNNNDVNFTTMPDLEATWRFVDAIQSAWEKDSSTPSEYFPGTFGPTESDALLTNDGRHWYNCD